MSAEAVRRYIDGDALGQIASDFKTDFYSVRQAVKDAGELRPTSERISRAFRDKKVKKRWCNDDFFESIDTEEKAYWLGFLTADGNVFPRAGAAPAKISIHLSGRDEQHLHNFMRDIDGNYKVGLRERVFRFGDRVGRNTMATVQVYSDKMAEDLAQLGVVPRKSCKETPATQWIPEHLHPHYWRGLVDGDGCLSFNKHRSGLAPTLILVGSEAMCEAFKAWVEDNVQATISANVRKLRRGKELHQFRLSGKPAALASDALYRHANVYLERKMNRALIFEGWVEGKEIDPNSLPDY